MAEGKIFPSLPLWIPDLLGNGLPSAPGVSGVIGLKNDSGSLWFRTERKGKREIHSLDPYHGWVDRVGPKELRRMLKS